MNVRLIGMAAFASALGGATMAQATEYYLSNGSAESITGVDLTRMTTDAISKTAWVTVIYAKPQDVGGKRYSWTMARISVNCGRQTFQIGKSIFYDSEGNSIGDVDQTATWSDIVPDTLADTVGTVLCKPETRQEHLGFEGSGDEFREYARRLMAAIAAKEK